MPRRPPPICSVVHPRRDRLAGKPQWEVAPVLRVRDVRAAVNLYVSDCASLYEEFKPRGANILQAPEVAFYGMEEVIVLDLDGYVITFGSQSGAEEAD